MRYDRGIVRSDMAHMNMWVASGCMNWKSQKLLCADCAWQGLVIVPLRRNRLKYLWDLVVRLGLSSMNNIGEFHGVLNEKDGNVVSDNIPVTLLGVELHSKSTNIAHRISRTTASKHG